MLPVKFVSVNNINMLAVLEVVPACEEVSNKGTTLTSAQFIYKREKDDPEETLRLTVEGVY